MYLLFCVSFFFPAEMQGPDGSVSLFFVAEMLGPDGSIPLSPQWLLPKPGENKSGMVTGISSPISMHLSFVNPSIDYECYANQPVFLLKTNKNKF